MMSCGVFWSGQELWLFSSNLVTEKMMTHTATIPKSWSDGAFW